MKGYRREKNTQAILATDYSALMLHRKGLEEKNQLKNKVNTLENEASCPLFRMQFFSQISNCQNREK